MQFEHFDDFTLASSWERYFSSTITSYCIYLLCLQYSKLGSWYIQVHRIWSYYLFLQVHIRDRGSLPAVVGWWHQEFVGMIFFPFKFHLHLFLHVDSWFIILNLHLSEYNFHSILYTIQNSALIQYQKVKFSLSITFRRAEQRQWI